MAIVDGHTPERRRSLGAGSDSYSHGGKRYFDAKENLHVVKLFSGDWYVSTHGGEMLATILGSCVSACIRDPIAGVGGMNHFLLPGDERTELQNGDAAARYGVFAMETLINAIMKAGGQKSRFEVKVFGGGNVLSNSARIGSKNAAFIREFLKNEGFRIASEDLEGDLPRRLHYYPDTGKVMLRHLRRREDFAVVEEEDKYKQSIAAAPASSGDVELF